MEKTNLPKESQQKIKTTQGDITKAHVDAIVNATDFPICPPCGDLTWAIFDAAGYDELVEICEKIDSAGELGVGDAVVTEGLRLPAKYIIHTIAAKGWEPEGDEALFSNYYISLARAEAKEDIRSIAFPEISTGGRGFSLERARRIMKEAIMAYFEDNKDSRIEEVYIYKTLGKNVERNKKYDGLNKKVSSSNNWQAPPISLLDNRTSKPNPGDTQANMETIQDCLAEFKINVEMEGVNLGPRLTQYTLRPARGVSASKIFGKEKDLGRRLAHPNETRISFVEGTDLIGIEIENEKSANVSVRQIFESGAWKNSRDPLMFAVGQTVDGQAMVANLGKMPHLLVAGTTGSGKTSLLNTIITSLIYRNSPDDLKLILNDRKGSGFAPFEGTSHMIAPVLTEPEQEVSSLIWAAKEMDRRFSKVFKEAGVSEIEEYNEKVATERIKDGEKMPYIVIVFDELADAMLTSAAKELENVIARIAVKGRQAGIRLVLGLQHPTVKVLPSQIKANIPAKIALHVASISASMVVIDEVGAENLLMHGDMLMIAQETKMQPKRFQSAYISNDEIKRVAAWLSARRAPEYVEDVVTQKTEVQAKTEGGAVGRIDYGAILQEPIVREIVEYALSAGSLSTSDIQRNFGLGFGKASRYLDALAYAGVVGERNGPRPRELMIGSLEEFEKAVE